MLIRCDGVSPHYEVSDVSSFSPSKLEGWEDEMDAR